MIFFLISFLTPPKTSAYINVFNTFENEQKGIIRLLQKPNKETMSYSFICTLLSSNKNTDYLIILYCVIIYNKDIKTIITSLE